MKEKILFWISEEFTHFSIAYYLQKHTDYELYAIVDVPNRSKKFYQTQKLVNFKKVWFIHDHIIHSRIYCIFPIFYYLRQEKVTPFQLIKKS